MSGLIIETPSSVITGNWTVSTLPDPTLYARKYAWTTDLFGGPGDYCISDGTSWKPVRPLALNTVASSNQNMTLTPLLSAPTQVMAGALTANRTITLATTYAYSGARFRIMRQATGLSALLIAVIGTSLGLSSWADFEFDGTNWVQTASGGLL